MDTTKNLYDVKNIDELKEIIANLLKEVSKFHPNYPVHGYDYVDGKLVSVVREQHTIENRCIVCGAIIPEGRQVCPNCMEGFVPEQEQEDPDQNTTLQGGIPWILF